MSTITLTKADTPSAPPADKVKIHVSTLGKLSITTSTGTSSYDATDLSTISVTGADGLSGGGNLSASRTITLPNVTTAGSFGDASNFATFTVDAKGRITAASAVSVNSALPNTGTAGTYGTSTSFPIVTTDVKGRVTGVTTSTVLGAIPDSTAAGIHGDGASYPIITVDSKGRVTAASTASVVSALPNVVTAATVGDSGNYPIVTFDAKGRVTGASVSSVLGALPAVVTAGTYGSATAFPVVTLDAKGRVTAVSTSTVAAALPDLVTPGTYGSASSYPIVTLDAKGKVTAVSSSSVEGALSDIVTAGTYGDISNFPIVTVDAKGRVTSVSTSPVGGGGVVSVKTVSPLSTNSNVTNVAIPELTLTLAANTTYQITLQLIYSSAATNTGLSVTFGGGSLSPSSIVGHIDTNTTGTTLGRASFNSLTTQSTFTSVSASNVNRIADGVIIVATGATGGTLIPAFRSSRSGTLVSLNANSKITMEVL
jgi:hypothetical protein